MVAGYIPRGLDSSNWARHTVTAQEWLQIDTDLLPIMTSTADELSGGTNIDDLERP